MSEPIDLKDLIRERYLKASETPLRGKKFRHKETGVVKVIDRAAPTKDQFIVVRDGYVSLLGALELLQDWEEIE